MRSMSKLEINLKKKNEAIEELESINKEVQTAIETVIKTHECKTINTGRPISVNTTDNYDQQPAQQYQLSKSHGNQDDQSRFLKPLKIPTFIGDKQKFADFLALFRNLVDESLEPANLKMARLPECLPGNALEAIRSREVTTPEYEIN